MGEGNREVGGGKRESDLGMWSAEYYRVFAAAILYLEISLMSHLPLGGGGGGGV